MGPGAEILHVELSPFPRREGDLLPFRRQPDLDVLRGFPFAVPPPPNLPVTAWNRFTSNGIRDPLRSGGETTFRTSLRAYSIGTSLSAMEIWFSM